MKATIIITLSILFFITSCSSNIREGNEITESELSYIKELGLLDEDESIILFDSQSSFEISGNFFTDRRMACYFANNKPNEDHATFAYYEDIDSLTFVDRISDISYASYIEVYVNNSSRFKVYIDADSTKSYNFYNKSKAQWSIVNE